MAEQGGGVMNRVFLYGHLGADPDLKMTNGGTPVLKLRLATNERMKKGDEWVDHTEWHNVIVWGKRAEGLAKVVEKGTALLVEGNIRTRSWEDNDGNKRYSTEINSTEVKLAGKREGGGNGGGNRSSDSNRGGGQRQQRQQHQPAGGDGGDYGGPDDDIPF
jgi:single-strand DNA-binding protein